MSETGQLAIVALSWFASISRGSLCARAEGNRTLVAVGFAVFPSPSSIEYPERCPQKCSNE
ncbi:hypothetical protein M408DRAFT_325321 [Serendipita vermifera MAFF 305830]|uniref:Uncharacterized protein n=1 Tax=Serendipita vermifera MAFF 305830 TaxID=933852 RepID=A0A0C3BQK3_SERVB|nr:hypothetical protein M408DRAFT_326756 [Serendipita vermifera MAFF 305830]KIM33706.1 hypothetical protein M408DRAFT_325321 [Serendipita vermifera MAFF 305830]